MPIIALVWKNYKKYKCGKSKKIMDLGEEGTRISGIRVIQHSDYSFTWHMNEYAKESLAPIQVPRGFLFQTDKLDEGRMSEVISLNGKKWLAWWEWSS